jgi:hypothetical protein
MSITDLLQILIIVVIFAGAAFLAKAYFTPKKSEKEIWKKNALNYNKMLDEAFNKKKEDDYKELLHPKVSRYLPKLPHRVDGDKEVMKFVKNDMEAPAGATSVVQFASEIYDQIVLITYNYMTQTKVGDKFHEGVGKVTRVWVRVDSGWKLVHEHNSSVSKE